MTNEFFIRDCYGEFALNKIEYVIKKLNQETKFGDNDKKNIRLIIEEIGEPILRNKLLEMYNVKIKGSEEERDEKLKLINALKNVYGDLDERKLLEKVNSILTKDIK